MPSASGDHGDVGPEVGDPFAGVYERLTALRSAGAARRTVRVRPALPCVAFSRRDENHPGFVDAVEAAEGLGYPALVRPVGGTFVPLDAGSLIVDEFGYSGPGEWPQERYRRHVETLVAVFRGWGVDAHIGELAGEYCPGRYSVHHAGRFKISGTAQRVAGGAWLVSSVVRVLPIDPLIPVLSACSDALGAGVDPEVAGSLHQAGMMLPVAAAGADIRRRFQSEGADLVGDPRAGDVA